MIRIEVPACMEGIANPKFQLFRRKRASVQCVGGALLALHLGIGLTHVCGADPQNWPAWRRDGSGISADNTLLPVRWDPQTNVAWKTPLAGQGNSSPVVWDQKIYLTSWDDEGRRRSVICLNTSDGRIVWQTSLPATVFPTEQKNGYASGTCATDGKTVFAFFDSPGLIALNCDDGKIIWQRPLGPFTSNWGMVSSPILWRDFVVVACDHYKGSFIAAIDRASGNVRWKTPREDRLQYAVPMLINHQGTEQLVVNGQPVVSYAPADGKILWTCRGMKEGCVPTAQYTDGLVWVTSGRNGPAIAIDPSGSGDIADTHVRAHVNSGGCYLPSPLIIGHRLLLPGDDGNMRLVAASGEVVLQTRVRGHFSSSPIQAGDHVYWSNERGKTYVIEFTSPGEARPSVRTIAENDLGEPILSSPAACGGQLYIRTDAALYCLRGDRPVAGKPDASGPEPVLALDQIQARFRAHPGDHGPDVAIRLDMVEAASRQGGAEVAPFLLIAARDAHWDVSTAASKALARMGSQATDQLIDLLKETGGQGYLNVLAAESLGDLRVARAVPGLIGRAQLQWDPTVRIACLRALAKIGTAPGVDPAPIANAIVKGMSDPESTVRLAAIEAAGTLGPSAGAQRGLIIDALKKCEADKNHKVADAAAKLGR